MAIIVPVSMIFTGAVADSTKMHSAGVFAIVLPSLAVVLAAITAWPVRVLDVTPEVLRFRERRLPAGFRYGWRRRTSLLRSLAWRDVAEVLIASDHGRVAMVVGFHEPYAGLGAAMVELPTDNVRAVADAVLRVAPGAVVRQGRIAEILIRTCEPYVLRRWGIRTQLVVTAIGVFGAVGGFVLLENLLGPDNLFKMAQMWFWVWVTDAWLEQRLLVITPESVSVGTWWRRRAVPWATVGDARLIATGDGAELTITTAERTVTYRLPEVSDLGELDALIRAYAPLHALSRPIPGQVSGAA